MSSNLPAVCRPELTIERGRLVIKSFQVARLFCRTHADILLIIENLPVSKTILKRNFVQKQNSTIGLFFNITKTGFELVAKELGYNEQVEPVRGCLEEFSKTFQKGVNKAMKVVKTFFPSETHSPQPVHVEIHESKPTVTSLQVAYSFGKDHDNVLRDIRNLAVSQGFADVNLMNGEYTDQTGRSLPMYRLTRDGFMILAMGYTGAKAMALKEAYIAEFNRMEAELANRPSLALPDFTDPAAAAIAWAEQYKAKALAQQQLALAAPKAEVYDAVVADRRLTLNVFCRRLRGVNLLKVKESLMNCGVLYRAVGGRVYRVYAKYRNTHFEEKFDSATGNCTILVLEEGQKLLTNLYNAGQLIMKQGYDHNGSGVAES